VIYKGSCDWSNDAKNSDFEFSGINYIIGTIFCWDILP